MIIGLLYLIAGSVLYTIGFLFGPLAVIFPPSLMSQLQNLLTIPGFLYNIFPFLPDLIIVLGWLITIFIAKLYLSLVIMLLNLIPGINIHLPRLRKK